MTKKYQEPESLNQVAAFHEVFDLPRVEAPCIPPKERCDLRVNLIQEELNELKEAIEGRDVVGIADALADLQYVLSGAVLEFGLAQQFKELFDEVHRSNMSKTCHSLEEAEATQKYYRDHKSTQSYIVQRNGEYLVYREGDAKVLKSINYSEADLGAILS